MNTYEYQTLRHARGTVQQKIEALGRARACVWGDRFHLVVWARPNAGRDTSESEGFQNGTLFGMKSYKIRDDDYSLFQQKRIRRTYKARAVPNSHETFRG